MKENKEVIWPKNLRQDLDSLYNYIIELEKYIEVLKKKKDDSHLVFASIMGQFSDSLYAVYLLLKSNYDKNENILNVQAAKTSTVFLYLRKILEADLLLNIMLNTGGSIYSDYLKQESYDQAHVNKMFNGSTGEFHTNEARKEKYAWLTNHAKRKVKSLDDLINLAHLTKESKANIKVFVSNCNYMSHPTLYSDDKLLDFITMDFIRDFRYIFNIIFQMTWVFYDMIKHIENTPEYKTGYPYKSISKHLTQYNIFKQSFFDKDETKNYQFIAHENIDFNEVAYNIRAEYSFVNIILTSPFSENRTFKIRKERTIGKLLDVLVEDLRALLIGYYHKNNLIFYSKIRQVFEDISYIDKILEMKEEEIELFQAYTDIQRYINMLYDVETFKEIDDETLDIKKIIVNKETGLTAEKYYFENINFYKKHFKNKYNRNIKTNFIKRINSWAYDGKRVPSNWMLIKKMLEKNKTLKTRDIKFYSGLYSISSLFSHVGHFTKNNKTLSSDEFYDKVLYNVLIVVKDNFNKLLKLTPKEFQTLMKKNKLTLDKLLTKLEKNVTI